MSGRLASAAASVRSGENNGISVTSWPARRRAEASALSRMQLPQYMPPAPAARMLIFKRCCSASMSRRIVGPARRWAKRSRRRAALFHQARTPPDSGWRLAEFKSRIVRSSLFHDRLADHFLDGGDAVVDGHQPAGAEGPHPALL